MMNKVTFNFYTLHQNIWGSYTVVGSTEGWNTFHSVFCLTTGPKPPPKQCLHIVLSRASAFK